MACTISISSFFFASLSLVVASWFVRLFWYLVDIYKRMKKQRNIVVFFWRNLNAHTGIFGFTRYHFEFCACVSTIFYCLASVYASKHTHTGYPVPQNTLSFIAATHRTDVDTTYACADILCWARKFLFFYIRIAQSAENGCAHSFVVFSDFDASAHSYLFYYSLRWNVNSIEYHPGNLMGLDFSIMNAARMCVCECLHNTSIVYTDIYLYAQCQNTYQRKLIYTILNGTRKGMRMWNRICGMSEWATDRGERGSKNEQTSETSRCSWLLSRTKTEARPREKPSIRIAHTHQVQNCQFRERLCRFYGNE